MCEEAVPTWPDAPNQNLIIIQIIESDLLPPPALFLLCFQQTSVLLICPSVFVIALQAKESKKSQLVALPNVMTREILRAEVSTDLVSAFSGNFPYAKGVCSSILSQEEGEGERVGRPGLVRKGNSRHINTAARPSN